MNCFIPPTKLIMIPIPNISRRTLSLIPKNLQNFTIKFPATYIYIWYHDVGRRYIGMARMPASRNTFSKPPNSQTKKLYLSTHIPFICRILQPTFGFIICCERNESIFFHFSQYSGSSSDLRAGGEERGRERERGEEGGREGEEERESEKGRGRDRKVLFLMQRKHLSGFTCETLRNENFFRSAALRLRTRV